MTIEVMQNKVNLPVTGSYGDSTIEFYFEEADGAKIRSAFRNLFEQKQSSIVPLSNGAIIIIDCNRGSRFSIEISVCGKSVYSENFGFYDFEIFNK